MITCDAFFDIETANWTDFVCGALTMGSETFISYNEKEFYERLLDIPGEVWSWNGGLFDLLWVLDMAKKRKDRANIGCAGTRITRMQIGQTTFRDSVALIPMSLQKASEMVGRPISKDTGLTCKCGDDCGGYCAITKNMPQRQKEALSAYLRIDCEVGWQIMQHVLKVAEKSGLELTGTVGGSSYKTASNQLDLESADWSWRDYSYCREAYFGGRTQVFRCKAQSGFRYDIHSAYPAALSKLALPWGDSMRVSADKAQRAFSRQKEGVYRANVDVPKMHIPPLPWRSGQRVCYPVGKFSGHWTRLELAYAESLGCEVEIVSGYVWAERKIVFREFLEHLWKMRAEAGTSSATGKWLKFVVNSLTGKFAENPQRQRIILNPHDEQILQSKCKWNMLDKQGYLWGAPFVQIPHNGHIHWAAYLTSATRIELHKQLTSDGAGGLTSIYCDTDSVYSTVPREHNLGDDLGQWGYDGPMTDWYTIAPKAYAYTDGDGVRHCRAKGLSGITPDQFDDFIAGKPHEVSRGVMGLKSAAKKGGDFFRRKTLVRSNRRDGYHFGDRLMAENGTTIPQTVEQIRKWQKET